MSALTPAPHEFSRATKLAELQRELKARRHVFPGLVEKRRLTPGDAAYRIAIMEAIAADYREPAQQGSLL